MNRLLHLPSSVGGGTVKNNRKAPLRATPLLQVGEEGLAPVGTESEKARSSEAAPHENPVPELEINVFGGYEVLLGGKPLEDATVYQRRVKLLLGILAVNQGKELYCDYVASSIWPDSNYEKRRKGFYNVWWMLMRAICPGTRAADNPYFQRHNLTCCLMDGTVLTDAKQILGAGAVLSDSALDASTAMQAYRQLQQAYKGELIPGEDENPIILRARGEWRDFVCESLYRGALTLKLQGDYQTALWLVQAACRVDPYREDILRLRMRMLIDAGRSAAALQAYNDARALFDATVGVPLSPKTDELYVEIVGFRPVRIELPLARKRRGAPRRTRV